MSKVKRLFLLILCTSCLPRFSLFAGVAFLLLNAVPSFVSSKNFRIFLKPLTFDFYVLPEK